MPSHGLIVSATPTLDTNAYASGDHLGSLMEFDIDDKRGAIKSVSVVEKKDTPNKVAIVLLLFKDEPTITSADNAALDISDSELSAKFIGKVNVASTDYEEFVNGAVATVQTDLPIQSKGGKLWGILMSKGTPTYAASDLVIKLGL